MDDLDASDGIFILILPQKCPGYSQNKNGENLMNLTHAYPRLDRGIR